MASPSENLANTGYGINDVKLARKAWIAPGQRCTRFDISPVNYTFEVQAMSAEKLPFILPAVFTIGLRADDDECLLRYAKLISPHNKLSHSHHVNQLVKGVIEAEIRVLAASMTMEEIFRGTKSFKQAVFENVQLELNQFGLIMYNANVKQLVDVPGHEHFSPVNYKFEVLAMSAEKLPFILQAVFTIGPRTDDKECLIRYAKLISPHDKLPHHVNQLVKDVFEGETRVLAASITMEEIFRGTMSFKQAVFENAQPELNQFGLIIYNANIKQLVDVPNYHEDFSYLAQKTQQEAADQAKVDVAVVQIKGEIVGPPKEREGVLRHNVSISTAISAALTIKHKAASEQQAARVAEVEAAKAVAIRDAELQVEVERWNARQKEKVKADADYEMRVEEEAQRTTEGDSNQEGRTSKMDQIMGWACQLLKPQILQIVYGNDDNTDCQLKQQMKSLSSYSLKALWFAMPMFYASLTHHYSTSTAFGVEDTLFLMAIITDAALILLLPKWGNALVCISWLLLELATCLLILSFNKHYAFAILAALLLAVAAALLQPKLQHAADKHVLPFFTQDMIGDEENPYLGHLLDLSQGIASFGGLFTSIAGHFMVGPVNAVGFFFFCAIALGLYLSMVVTVGAVTRPHAKCLAIVVMVLVVLTFIAACIPFVGHSGSKPQVVTK